MEDILRSPCFPRRAGELSSTTNPVLPSVRLFILYPAGMEFYVCMLAARDTAVESPVHRGV